MLRNAPLLHFIDDCLQPGHMDFSNAPWGLLGKVRRQVGIQIDQLALQRLQAFFRPGKTSH